jgi:hypothetical protein
MSKDNSPMYAQGTLDGMADTDRVRNGDDPLGPQPPNPDYPWMYLKGYEDAYDPAAEDQAS